MIYIFFCIHINVPSNSLVKIALWTFVEAKFPKIEIKHDALFEDWWYKGRNICQIGPNWLCISTTIFKRASCFISILVIWASTKVHKVIFTSEALGTFFWCQHSLATLVVECEALNWCEGAFALFLPASKLYIGTYMSTTFLPHPKII